MKRRSLVLFLTVIMMMTCISVPAFAGTEDEINSDVIKNISEENSTQDMEDEESIQEDDEDLYFEELDDESIEEDTKGSLKAPALKKRMESTQRVLLDWNKVKGADGYVIYKAEEDDDYFEVFKKVGKTKTKYMMKNVEPGEANNYIVKAYSASDGKISFGKSSNNLKVKTPKVLKQNSKDFKETNAYKVIKAAKTKLGCAYVSGAAGPRAFDCSGYTYYVYNKMKSVKGIGTKKFTRSSAQGNYNALKKYNIGRNIKKAQPGDIMLFSHSGRPGNIHHAALYYGNGKIIHASSPGTGVIISKIAFRKVAAIIRLPKM